jgi:hypothetical protein
MPAPPICYSRVLPGGGFVAIDCAADRARHHARLWVERRADPARRAGHAPPVIVEAAGDDESALLARLTAIAGDNVALASAIRQWQAGGEAES